MVIKEGDEMTGDIVQFRSDDFIFVAELTNCKAKELKEEEEYEADLTFFCHQVIGVYKNEEEFHKENENMASESYIPVGAFPANPDDQNFRPSAFNYINSIVKRMEPNEKHGAPDNYIMFVGKIYNKELDEILYYPTIEEKDDVQEGYIVSGMFWIELDIINKEGNEVC